MKKKSIISLVFLLAIGFASVSATLIINGTIGIGTNDSNFIDGVVFDEESLSSSDGTIADISESGRTITFTTQDMKSINETATLTFKIKNYSQYDAVLGTPAISCYFVDDHQVDAAITTTPTTPTTHEYMTLTPGTELDGKTITAGGGISDPTSVTVKQKKSYTGDEKQTVKFQCVINATAKGSSTVGIEKTTMPIYNVTFNVNGGNDVGINIGVKYGRAYGELPVPSHNNSNYTFSGWYTESGEKVSSTTKVNLHEDHLLKARWMTSSGYEISNDVDGDGIVDIGDEISLGTENFYVISNNGSKINALAKYNLKVGGVYTTSGTLESTISSSEEGYGIQNAQMRGYINGEKRYGTVAFSNSAGWPYANYATINVKDYDGPVKTALYGENGYEKYIQQSIPDASVRLITKAELENLGCSASNNTCKSVSSSWVYSTSYWIGTAEAYVANDPWSISTTGGFSRNGSYSVSNVCGVRPVVEIPLT